jgi:hypothetical protein
MTWGEWYDAMLRLGAQGKLASSIDPDGQRRWWLPQAYQDRPLDLN